MTTLDEQTAADVRLPRAGTIGVYAVTTATTIDLGTGGPVGGASDEFGNNSPPANNANSVPGSSTGGTGGQAPINPNGWLGRWIDIDVDAGGGDLGFVSGPTLASVSGGNVPNLSQTGVAAGACKRIAAGGTKSYIPRADDRYLGVISSSGTCTVRISLSGR